MQDSSYHQLTAYSLVAIVLFLFFPKTLNGMLISLKARKQRRLCCVTAASGNAGMNQTGSWPSSGSPVTCNHHSTPRGWGGGGWDGSVVIRPQRVEGWGGAIEAPRRRFLEAKLCNL